MTRHSFSFYLEIQLNAIYHFGFHFFRMTYSREARRTIECGWNRTRVFRLSKQMLIPFLHRCLSGLVYDRRKPHLSSPSSPSSPSSSPSSSLILSLPTTCFEVKIIRPASHVFCRLIKTSLTSASLRTLTSVVVVDFLSRLAGAKKAFDVQSTLVQIGFFFEPRSRSFLFLSKPSFSLKSPKIKNILTLELQHPKNFIPISRFNELWLWSSGFQLGWLVTEKS